MDITSDSGSGDEGSIPPERIIENSGFLGTPLYRHKRLYGGAFLCFPKCKQCHEKSLNITEYHLDVSLGVSLTHTIKPDISTIII